MFNRMRLTPFFEEDSGGGGDWFSIISQSASNDEQPEGDSEDMPLETDTETPDESEQPEGQPESEETEVDEDPEVDMGDDRTPIKLSELKDGYWRQSDYTKKTTALKAEREAFETEKSSLEPIKQWKDHMESNPWLWQQINLAIKQFNESEVLPIDEVLEDAQYGKYLNRLMSENNRLTKELEKVNGEYEGVKLTTSMRDLRDELRGEYGDLVTDEYMTELQTRAKDEKLSPATLKEIAEGKLAKESLKQNKGDIKKASKEAEAKALQKLAETKKSAPITPKAPAKPPAKEELDNSGDWGTWLRSRAPGN